MDAIMDSVVNFLAIVFCKFGNWTIVVLALINIGVYITTKNKIKDLKNMLTPKSDKVNGVSPDMGWSDEEIAELKEKRKDLIKKYTWYANITAIFPLLGILGTVAALVTYSGENEMENLMIALGTTLMGVLFAIVSKLFDANLSAPMDVTIEDADCAIQNHDSEKRRRNEA